MKVIDSLLSPLHPLAAKLRRARPGSVLIIVIVLLLLLAILGAALISTTRSSRVASAQNVQNADVDSMVNGVANACEGVIQDDLNDSFGDLYGSSSVVGSATVTQAMHGVYRGAYTAGVTYNLGDIVSQVPPTAPAPPPYTPPNYYVAVVASPSTAPLPTSSSPWKLTTNVPNITSSVTQPWLAERTPTPDGVTGTPAVLAYWPNVSQSPVPIGGTLPTSIIGVPFESPDGTAMPALTPGQTLAGSIGSSLVPGFKQLGGPTGPFVPTLTYQPAGGVGVATTLVAGDADGDGVADSFLFRLPGASFDGLTWYGAVRIIDNNSAINVNTAMSRDQEYTLGAGGTTPGGANYFGLFPTSVGLYELLNASDQAGGSGPPIFGFNALNSYRFGSGAALAPAQADPIPGSTSSTAPVSRADIQFVTAGDLLYNQLIRRITNPGYNGGGNRCQPLTLADEASLAYHFCLLNTETPINQIAPSTSESLLPYSLLTYAAGKYYRSTPYGSSAAPGGGDVNSWFNDNFDFDNPPGDYSTTAGAQPLRSLLVTRNPVSNSITPVYDANTTNYAEPLEPLGALGNPYTAPAAGTIPGMMLPYGMGPPAPASANPPFNNYSHFKGPWNGGQPYQFNDIVVGGDGYTYIYVAPPGAPAPTGTQAVAPTLANLPPATFPGGQGLYAFWQFQPWTKSPQKANVNTATFRELYRAFWCAMAGNPSNQSTFGANVDADPYWPDSSGSPPLTYNPQHQFRSPLRDPTYSGTPANATRLDPENTTLLRAAIAAVNTLGLRDSSQNVISRTVYLNAIVPSLGASPQPVMARVYSNAPAPVISEVYANSSSQADPQNPGITNANGYVAVELYNPYSVPLVLTNWQLGLVNRDASGGTYPNLVFTVNGTSSVIAPGLTMQAQNDPRSFAAAGAKPAPGVIVLNAHGYALLENYNGSGSGPGAIGDAQGRPYSSGIGTGTTSPLTPQPTGIYYGPGGQANPNTCDVYVPGLQLVIKGAAGATMTGTSPGGELVLLRPRRSDGSYTACTDPLNTFTEGSASSPNLYDLVPIDSFDFTGMTLGSQIAWSYVRVKGAAQTTWFKQIYPGRYFINSMVPNNPRYAGAGTDSEPIAPAGVVWTNTNATPMFGLDVLPGKSSYTNNFPPIQVYNSYSVTAGGGTVQAHWPNPLTFPTIPTTNTQAVTQGNATIAVAPFGAFARNGDILDVPYVGAYRISLASSGAAPVNFVELNSLPMDCSFADATYPDTDTADQSIENIGRFCPMAARAIWPPAGGTGLDFYSWTKNLFNYLTVQSSSDAELPDYDPNINDPVTCTPAPPPPTVGTPANPSPNTYHYVPYDLAGAGPPAFSPAPVLSNDATALDQTSQGNAGIDGLININTASWRVLSMLPMVTANEDSANYKKDNEALAKAIVAWRNTHGPFNSIYDLNSVIDYVTGGASSTVGFQNAEGFLKIASGGASGGVSSLNGLLSPPDPLFPNATSGGSIASGVSEDYQSDFAVLDRISNLITTRSDTFTVYVEVQGWQNVGTANAQPVITRRYAYIVDRSAIGQDPSTRYLKTLTVPNN